MQNQIVSWGRKAGILTISIITMSGCALSGPSNPKSVQPFQSAPKSEVASLGKLTVNNLPQGACGMLLWTLDGTSSSLVFRTVVQGDSMMVFDGKPTSLSKIRENGARRFGVPSDYVFSAQVQEYQTEITVTTEWGLPFEGGAYVERGTISVIKADGWERVTPVAGLAGCRK